MNNVGFAPGVVGQAFRFDGTDQYINLGPWFTNQNFSFAMWLKEGESQVGYANIFDNNHTGSRSLVLQYNNTARQYIFGGGFPGVPFDLTPGVWQHLVVTRELGLTSRVYLDGRLVSEAAAPNPIPYDGSEYLRLGTWGGGGRHWKGLLDEFQIYDRALTSNQVQTLYSAGTSGICSNTVPQPGCTPPPTNLIGWWRGESAMNEVPGGDPALLLNGANLAQGFVGNAFRFDGNDDQISIGYLPALQGATELSLSAWVLNQPGSDNVAGILGQWDTTGNAAENSFLLYSGEAASANRGGFALQFADGSTGFLVGTNPFPVGTWMHIAATWRNSDGLMRIYKNGVLDATGTNGVGKILHRPTAFTAKIGEWGKNNNGTVTHWRGMIDEPMIVKRALSSNEVAAIFASGPAGLCQTFSNSVDLASGLQGHWSFDNANNLGEDSSSNHNTPDLARKSDQQWRWCFWRSAATQWQ